MRKFAVIAAATLVVLPASVSAGTPELPDHAADRVAEARAHAKDKAEQFADDKARGHDENTSTGLDRAAEVSKSWRFTGEDKPGNGGGNDNPGGSDNESTGNNGKALGAGRAEAVHEALANGLSPSSLDSHGEAVSAVAREMGGAYNALKARSPDHPGQGEGKGLGGPGGDDD